MSKPDRASDDHSGICTSTPKQLFSQSLAAGEMAQQC